MLSAERGAWAIERESLAAELETAVAAAETAAKELREHRGRAMALLKSKEAELRATREMARCALGEGGVGVGMRVAGREGRWSHGEA